MPNLFDQQMNELPGGKQITVIKYKLNYAEVMFSCRMFIYPLVALTKAEKRSPRGLIQEESGHYWHH